MAALDSTSTGAGARLRSHECSRSCAANGCATVVIENRYVDADYRSDFSAFWSLRFEPRTGFARRMHFFTKRVEEAELHALPEDHGYLGYVILRPVRVRACRESWGDRPASNDPRQESDARPGRGQRVPLGQ